MVAGLAGGAGGAGGRAAGVGSAAELGAQGVDELHALGGGLRLPAGRCPGVADQPLAVPDIHGGGGAVAGPGGQRRSFDVYGGADGDGQGGVPLGLDVLHRHGGLGVEALAHLQGVARAGGGELLEGGHALGGRSGIRVLGHAEHVRVGPAGLGGLHHHAAGQFRALRQLTGGRVLSLRTAFGRGDGDALGQALAGLLQFLELGAGHDLGALTEHGLQRCLDVAGGRRVVTGRRVRGRGGGGSGRGLLGG
ncbi:hypothetical protein ACFFX0_24830 [Citricoccus parietis]|uniref:Uncharacterized protein n=1 Tax=Citricoccus parietis TaxID=592307 RepID=A0ABV5G5R4_9MICC